MQRLLHANAWISIGLGIFLTGSYYISFFHQISDFPLLTLLVVVALVLIQIRSSVAFVRFLLAFAQRVRSFLPKLLAKIIAFSVLLFMIVDAISLSLFTMKFSLGESFRMLSGGFQEEALISFDTLLGGVVVSLVVLLAIYFFYLSRKVQRVSRTLGLFLFAWILLSISTFSLLRSLSGPYLGSLLLNPLLYNLDEFVESYNNNSPVVDTNGLSGDYEGYFSSALGLNQKKNIIVIFAESFEPKYSGLSSGHVYDRLPQYDTMSQDGIRYENFLAPGCVSEDAHISFLQGVFPVSYASPNRPSGYQVFDSYVDSLPNFLNKQGYDTSFLSTVSLNFVHQRDFLEKMGFTTIMGEEYFSGTNYVFQAAPDKELYTKALSLVSEKNNSGKPFFLNMQTISTHTPRNTPYGKKEQNSWNYADDQISDFYEKLRKTNFFDNGVLVIFGDHRVPGTLSASEENKLGPLRPSKVLATVIGYGTGGTKNDMLVQPIDLHFSLKRLVGAGPVDVWNLYNDIFSYRSQRDWGLYYCKYRNNNIILMNTGSFGLPERYHTGYQYIKSFQEYQFEKNVLSGSQELIKAAPLSDLLVFGHAGAPAYAPRNTMSGFLTALSQGAHGLELDLSYTADKVNVVRHGPHPLNMAVDAPNVSFYKKNKCFGVKPISEWNYDEMRKTCVIENGENILTFDEFLTLTKDIVPLYMVEIKVDSPFWEEQMNDAIATVKNYGLEDKVIFVSYHPEVRKYFVSRDDLRSGRDMFNGDDYPSAEEVKNIEYLMTPFYELTGEHLLQLLSYKIPLITYTPSNTKEMEDVLFLKDYLHVPISGILVDDIPLFLQVYTQ